VAITHFTPQLIGRGNGSSAVLSAAYRHCVKMTYEIEARTVDYSNKPNLVHEEFLLPPGAPNWARLLIADRSISGASEAFWNRLEAFEKRADAQLAKEFIIALPIELSKEQNIALMRQYVFEQVLARGQVADWVYHDETGNPHVHLMTSLRPLTGDGFGPKKIVVIGADGKPVRTEMGKIQYRLWAGEKAEFLEQRNAWLALQNQHLALAGLEIRVDGRSYAERGLGIEPTIHIGVGAKAIQRKTTEEGKQAELDRLKRLEVQRQANARRIARRPETVLDIITSEKSVFDQRDIAKVLHRYVDDPTTFQELMARVLRSPNMLRIEGETVDFATGAIIQARFTTRELIHLEAAMAKRAVALSAKARFAVPAPVIERTFVRHSGLSLEQHTAIEHIAAPAHIVAVVGRAGAGKTTMMKAAREVWEVAGYRLIGGALAGKAAEGLEKEAGIESRTLAAWELRWKEGRDTLDSKTVFVLDEAGMVASKQMALFVEAASRTGAKLVLVGDPDQLQPIEAGAAFRAIVERIGYAELETIYRQREEWMRSASLDLARGEIEKAVDAYQRQGRVFGSTLKADAVLQLIDDWNKDYDPAKTTLILTHLRRDVRKLNELAREKLVERGLLGEGYAFHTEDGPRNFAVGDQAVFLRNDSALGVKNGMIGRIVEATAGRIIVATGEGDQSRRVTANQGVYRNIDHGYATTIHKSQGTTVDRIKVLASLSLDRHLTYVAMTRHREDLAVYYGQRSFELNGGLTKILSKNNAKETTLDYERAVFYRQALRFAENRGLHIARVARALLREQVERTLRQKNHLLDLGQRLVNAGQRLGTAEIRNSLRRKEAEPMLTGITVYGKSMAAVVEEKLQSDPALKKHWEDLSARFRYVFADPEGAFKTMNFAAIVADPGVAKQTLARLTSAPESFGVLKGKAGVLASNTDREARHVAEKNIASLREDIERYLQVRRAAEDRFEKDEQSVRQRMSIDIPALSTTAHRVLGRVRDAIDRRDPPAALGLAIADREVKAEIDALNRAVALRFGERKLLAISAREPAGVIFESVVQGLSAAQKQKLAVVWPLLRAAQQLAAHERTVATLKASETLRQSQRQSPILKP